MEKRFVYLAGPILNCTEGEANDWRKYVDEQLQARSDGNIRGISPLRCEPLVGDRYVATYEDPRFGTARAIGAKNKFDVQECDMTLAFFPDRPADMKNSLKWHQSYGTIVEVGWADGMGKKIMVVATDPEIKRHPVINACSPWMFDNFEDAIDTAIGILGGYTGGKNI